MKIGISTEYTVTACTVIDLPEGRAWEDVADYHVKWSELHLTFEDGTKFEVMLSTDAESDYKYPSLVEVRTVDGEGYINWDDSEKLSGYKEPQ